ncbi:adenosine deaminase-like protein (ADAT1h) [Trypanosoma cruzi cruzi]|nr:adenosine deaminase-like protein (ADAT1h) [Trypanosoma cruzi cruzi]
MDILCGGVPVARSILEAFAAALLCQPARDGWRRNAMSALNGGGAVIAGIVLQLPSSPIEEEEDTPFFICVSLGSGTRCVGYEPPLCSSEADIFLRDGHAEVMARRGFVAFLLDAALYLAQSETGHHPFVERCHFLCKGPEGKKDVDTMWQCFRLRDGVTVHLVSTEYPCGAMSIPRGGGHVLLSTPSGESLSSATGIDSASKKDESFFASCDAAATDARPVILSYGHAIAAHRSHPAEEMLHVGRVKPGKGRQNLCMSCSDKLLRWHCLGVQGRRRARLFPRPMSLTSVWLPQTPDGSADSTDYGASRNCSLEDAIRALNGRMCYFCPMMSLEGGDDGSKGNSQMLHSMPAPFPVSFYGFKLLFFRSLLTKCACTADTREKDDCDADKNGKSDSAWSRSAWLKMAPGVENDSISMLRSKRQREVDTSETNNDALSWRKGGVAVLNTKAGLPRGITKQDAERTAHELLRLQPALLGDGGHTNTADDAALEVIAKRFPLSRLWMAQQQRRVMQRLSRQRKDMSMGALSLLGKDGSQKHVDGMTISSFPLPVILFPLEGAKEQEAVVTGGSAHYWLQRARQSRNAMMNPLRNEGGTSAYIPLLWVEKGLSV